MLSLLTKYPGLFVWGGREGAGGVVKALWPFIVTEDPLLREERLPVH